MKIKDRLFELFRRKKELEAKIPEIVGELKETNIRIDEVKKISCEAIKPVKKSKSEIFLKQQKKETESLLHPKIIVDKKDSCPKCKSGYVVKAGFTERKRIGKLQQYRCKECKHKFTKEHEKSLTQEKEIAKFAKRNYDGDAMALRDKIIEKYGVNLPMDKLRSFIDKKAKIKYDLKQPKKVENLDKKTEALIESFIRNNIEEKKEWIQRELNKRFGVAFGIARLDKFMEDHNLADYGDIHYNPEGDFGEDY